MVLYWKRYKSVRTLIDLPWGQESSLDYPGSHRTDGQLSSSVWQVESFEWTQPLGSHWLLQGARCRWPSLKLLQTRLSEWSYRDAQCAGAPGEQA